jgi:hypothetical protein
MSEIYKIDIVDDESCSIFCMKKDLPLLKAAPMMLDALEAVAPFLHWLDQEQGIHLAGDMLHGNILAAIKAAKGEYEQ